MKSRKSLILLFLLAACRAYTDQLRWPEGTTTAQFKKDSDECEVETRTHFVDVANEMNAVGTSTGDGDDARRFWYRCMDLKGYALVKVPRSQPTTPQPEAQ